MKSSRDDVEIIFVSSDRDEASFSEYFGEMPWLALPFSKRAEKEALSSLFDVNGIPTLITLDAHLNVVNKSARGAADEDPTGKSFPWPPQPFAEISETADCNGSDVNETASLVVLGYGLDDDALEASQAALRSVAVAHAAKVPSGEDPELLFFTASKSKGPVTQVVKLTKLKVGEEPILLLLDIPDNGAFYAKTVPEVTPAVLEEFISAYKGKTLTRQQLG